MKKNKHGTFSGRPKFQNDQEFKEFLEEIENNNVQSYLEVGSKYGDTFYEVCKRMPKGSLCVAVDLVGGEWGKNNSEKYLKRAVEELKKEGYNAHMILGNSRSKKIINQVKSFGKFDAMLLDGDHRYEGIKADWKNYSPLANKLIAFHDIDTIGLKQIKNPNMVFGVGEIWQELKPHYEHKELIYTLENARPMGIGILYIDKSKE